MRLSTDEGRDEELALETIAAAADAGGEESQIRRVTQPLCVGGPPRDLLEPRFRSGRARPERGVCKRREQHDAGDALRRDVRKARYERLHRDAADRMTDERGPVQIETFEDGLDVASQVLQRVTFSSRHRATVTAMVEGDRAEALLRKLLELMEPGAH